MRVLLCHRVCFSVIIICKQLKEARNKLREKVEVAGMRVRRLLGYLSNDEIGRNTIGFQN